MNKVITYLSCVGSYISNYSYIPKFQCDPDKEKLLSLLNKRNVIKNKKKGSKS